MGLLGNGWDDPASQANFALADGLRRGDFVGGLLAANQAFIDGKKNALQTQLVQAQLANYASEVDARKLKTIQDERQQRMIESLFPGMASGQGGAAPATGAIPGAAAPAGAQAQGGNDILSLAKQLNIPPQAIQADLVFNGGKKISELLADRAKPNWQNISGNLVNTNAPGFQGGFQPGFSVSSDGRATAWQPDGNGGMVFGAPSGALETYKAYQNAGERSKADSDLVEVWDPQQQRPVKMTRSQVLQAANGGQGPAQQPAQPPARMPAAQSGVTGAFSGEPSQIMNDILSIRDPQERANAMAAFTEQAKRTQGFAAGGPLAAGPSTAEQIEKARALKQAETDVQPTDSRMNAIASAKSMIGTIDKALTHPGLATGTGLSGTLDPRNYIPGTDAKNFQAVRDQLRGGVFMQAYQGLKGGGQITEIEGRKAEDAIARLQTAQSTEAFSDALNDLKAVTQGSLARLEGSAKRAGVDVPSDGGSKPNLPKPMKGMVRGGYKFKGGDPSQPSSWEKL